MGVLLVLLSIVLAIAGILMGGSAGITLGVAGCICAILATIDHADRRHAAEIAMLERIERAIAAKGEEPQQS